MARGQSAVPYDHREVAATWSQRWAEARIGEVDLDHPASPPLYNLVEFPYPSAAGLHIGHTMTYCGADAWGRLQRMRGMDVFQPIGFDSFGINAENYALQQGRHPGALVDETAANYRRQLRAIGAAWSWDAHVMTSDPAYYRWTQWLFLQLFDAGLAYQAEAPVIWCPSCRTVLAREQVETIDEVRSRCERCGTITTERVLRQWFLRITAYADRLRAGLDGLDWPDAAKNRQRRWIDGLHDWLISRQRSWGPPIPIVHCPACGPVGVPEGELPVLLPEDAPPGTRLVFEPVPCPRCGDPGARRETDVSDTFLDSSWYFLRYCPTGRDQAPWDPERTARWLPVDLYAGGPEHVARHHLYARFVTMALYDLGLVPFEEPFPRIRLHGMITMGGAKMSKSRGNVVNPDDLVDAHGADVVRLALLFARPWSDDGDFRAEAITAAERFVGRVWRVVTDGHSGPDGPWVDQAIVRVTERLDDLRFNAAISSLMEMLKPLERDGVSARARRTLVLLLAPLAPYLAEELWARLGQPFSVHTQPWPEPVPSLGNAS